MYKSFQIANRTIGNGQPTFIVAEVAQAHDGSLGLAHAFIDSVAKAGADAIKFQTHIAAAESTSCEPWRVKFSVQDDMRYDYWKRMEFTETQWHDLKKHSDERGLIFLSSPFSMEAAELLIRVGVSAWKVASGELGDIPLIERMAEADLPFLISTGMSHLSEIDAIVELVRRNGLPFALLQCTSMYPTPAEYVGLNMIPFFRKRYDCAVGLSDHSGTIYAGLAAAALGIDILEVHVCLSREMFGPDVPVSVTTKELGQLVKGVQFINRALENPVDKDPMAQQLKNMRNLFTKSVVARMELLPGTIIREEHLAFKKPGTGIPATEYKKLLGVKLLRHLREDEVILWKDVEEKKHMRGPDR